MDHKAEPDAKFHFEGAAASLEQLLKVLRNDGTGSPRPGSRPAVLPSLAAGNRGAGIVHSPSQPLPPLTKSQWHRPSSGKGVTKAPLQQLDLHELTGSCHIGHGARRDHDDSDVKVPQSPNLVAEMARLQDENAKLQALVREDSEQISRLKTELEAAQAKHGEDMKMMQVSSKGEFEQTIEELKWQHAQELEQLQTRLHECEEEEKRVCASHVAELDRLHLQLQEREEELERIKESHAAELKQVRATMAEQKPQANDGGEGATACADQPHQPQRDEEIVALRAELKALRKGLETLEERTDHELEDYALFLKRLAATSSAPILEERFDLSTSELLNNGKYGYVMTCQPKPEGPEVVLKLQSERWASVTAREWAHGIVLGSHENIVQYLDVLMHRDKEGTVKRLLEGGFANGTLTGKKPRSFPESFYCLSLEFMDRGSVQGLMDKDLIDIAGVGAVTRQVAGAIAHIHRNRRTHNDIKPDNILLQVAPGGAHLIAKLADLGLVDHSMDRARDFNLFGYTIWCMCVRRRFLKCPTSEEDQKAALEEQRIAQQSRETSKSAIWRALHQVVAGLWQNSLHMAEVEHRSEFDNLEVKNPKGRMMNEELELAAKHEITRQMDQEVTEAMAARKSRVHRLLSGEALES